MINKKIELPKLSDKEEAKLAYQFYKIMEGERDRFKRSAKIGWLMAGAGWLVVALILFIR